MRLQDRMRGDLTAAMRSRDEVTTATLRMALTSVKAAEVAGSAARELSEDEVLAVLRTEVKKRREAAEAFTSGGAADRAARELAEEEVLAAYLPAQLSDDELSSIVAQAVAETGASGPQAMGAVMKVVSPKVAGRAEGGRVASAVRAALAG